MAAVAYERVNPAHRSGLPSQHCWQSAECERVFAVVLLLARSRIGFDLGLIFADERVGLGRLELYQ